MPARRINAQSEQRRVLNSIKKSVTAHPWLCLALMLFWTWLNLAIQGPFFFPPVMLDSGFMFLTWSAPIAASALAYFILSVGLKRTSRVFREKWYIGSVAGLMAIGALLCFLWIQVFGAALDTIPGIVLYISGSIAIGFGTALLMIEWGRIFGYLGPQEVLYQGIVAMLCSAVLVGALSFAPIIVGQLIFVLVPIPLAICLYRALCDLPRKNLYQHGLDATLKVPNKFLITAFLHGLSLGVLFGSLLVIGDQATGSLFAAISFVIAALLLLLTALFVKMDFNHLIYQIGFGITATGAFLIAIIADVPLVGISFQLVGFCYVHLVMWGLCSYLTKNFRLPAIWVVSLPTCCLMIGQLLGGNISNILTQRPDMFYWIQIMAMVMVFVLLMASLFMFSNRNLTTGWGLVLPSQRLTSDSSLESVAQQLTIENNITPREAEIFLLMARGRNRRVISEELVVSEETIKSHINSIYRKLDIHSQQELLDLVEDYMAKLPDANPTTVFK